jgi:hypothetical protein
MTPRTRAESKTPSPAVFLHQAPCSDVVLAVMLALTVSIEALQLFPLHDGKCGIEHVHIRDLDVAIQILFRAIVKGNDLFDMRVEVRQTDRLAADAGHRVIGVEV